MGNLSVGWNPAAGQPTVHAIKVHRGGQTIDVLQGASLRILRREDQLEQASLDGILTAIMRVDDLRVGDELEVAVTTPFSDPTLGGDDSGNAGTGTRPLSRTFPARRELGQGQEPKLKLTSDMASVAVRRAEG